QVVAHPRFADQLAQRRHGNPQHGDTLLGHDVGRARQADERGDLAKEIAGPQGLERLVLLAVLASRDGTTVEDKERAVAGIARADDRRAGWHRAGGPLLPAATP